MTFIADGLTVTTTVSLDTGGARSRARATPANLLIAGHSYQDPAGVQVLPQESIPTRLRDGLGLTPQRLRNIAVSGSQVRNHQTGCSYAQVWAALSKNRAAGPYIPDVSLFEFLYATNDAIRGVGADQMAGIEAATKSIIRRAQAGSVYPHDHATVTRTGTWAELLWANLGSEAFEVNAHSAANPWGADTGCWRTSTVGARVNIAVPAGHTGTVDLYVIGSWYGATVNVLVDGATVASAVPVRRWGLDWYGYFLYDERNGGVITVSGLAAGARQVSLVVASVDTGSVQNPGQFRFDSWSMRCQSGMDPQILALEAPIIPTPGSFWVGVTQPVIEAYNDQLRTIADAINGGAGKTWPVAVAPTETVSLGAGAAGFPDSAGHPNAYGCALVAAKGLRAYTNASGPDEAASWPASWQTDQVRELAIQLSTGNATVGAVTPGYTVQRAITLLDVTLSATTGPTGAALIADLNANGASITTTRAQILAGSKTGLAQVPSTTAVAAGTTLSADVDQIGSTVAGAGVRMVIRYTEN